MHRAEGSVPGWADLASGKQIARLVLVCFGVWLHAADGLMVATMMPAIVADIGGARFVSWTIALYEIGSICAGAASALLGMRYGLRAAMAVAALVYMSGCVGSALAPDMSIMLIGRLAQGLGGGGLVALSFVAVSSLFARPLMPRVMAAVSTLWGISAFIGPVVGGVFAELALWRGGFWFFAAQAGVLAAWIMLGLRGQVADFGVVGAGRLPLWRLLVLSLGVVAIASAGIDVSPIRSPVLVVIGVCLLALFFRMDARRDASRLLPRRSVDPSNGVGAGLLMVLSFSAATVALSVYGPLLMTRLHDVSALTAGYVVAASSIGWSIMAIVVSGAHERHDGSLILGGMCVLTTSVLGFMVTVPHGPVWLTAVFASLEGAGFGMAWTFVLRRATAISPKGDIERIATALPTIQRLGYAVGAAYTGIVANAAGLTDDFSEVTARVVGFWIFAACLPMAAAGLCLAWLFVRPKAPAVVAPSDES